jgi:hypothetical protein
MPYAEGGLGALNSGEGLDDPGVVIYFDLSKEQHCIACDRWNSVKDNILAIVDTVKCMRMIERRGSSETMKRAFSGFKALPPSAEDWRQVIGETSSLDEARKMYREKARELHSDLGGNDTMMTRLNLAWEACQKELQRK